MGREFRSDPLARVLPGSVVPRPQLFQAFRNPSTLVRSLACRGRRDARDPAPRTTPRGWTYVSMIRVTYGVIPAVRTGLTVTCPAAEDDSSIWPLPR